MDYILDKFLCKKFPNLYNQRKLSMNQTAMCWGFECGNGWFELIFNLSENLEKEIKKKSNRKEFSASQVKEKFAGLRFYMTCETDKMSNFIRKAEKLSYKICENCGEKGKCRGISWISTRCDKCWKKENA